MRLPWTVEFDAERETFGLRFACEDCGHFDERSRGCRHEWPNEPHRHVDGESRPSMVDFCKEFELC